jgi:hypothetical protein
MSALSFREFPTPTTRGLPSSWSDFTINCPLPQTFGGHIKFLRIHGPDSWFEFDTVLPTIASNAILEKIVNTADEALTLNSLMNRAADCFRFSLEVMFPGEGLVASSNQQPFASQGDSHCNELARLSMGSARTEHDLTLQWTQLYDEVTSQFNRLMSSCNSTVLKLRRMMHDQGLEQYARVNPVFKAWWVQRITEVNHLNNLLQDPHVIMAPTIKNVLTEMSHLVPHGHAVKITTGINGAYRLLCVLTTHNVELADNGQVLMEVERQSSGPDVGDLFDEMSL